MSQLYGRGYGDDHPWKRGATAHVGGAPGDQRFTEYSCAVCGAVFRHYYDLEPDIFNVIESAGISESCRATTKTPPGKSEEEE